VKAAKAAPKPKAASKAKAPLSSSTNSTAAGKSIEDIYQKKTQLEHILLRPDTYIGSTEKLDQQVGNPSCMLSKRTGRNVALASCWQPIKARADHLYVHEYNE